MRQLELQTILADCGYEPFSYSGRGMFGKSCLAIKIESLHNLTVLGFDVAASLYEKYIDNQDIDVFQESKHLFKKLKASAYDAMGTGYVLYFPGISFHET